MSGHRPWTEVRAELARRRVARDAGTCPGTPHRGHASSDASCPLERPDLKPLDVVPTNVTETRLVEADLGERYRRDHLVYATTGRGITYQLVPHRVRVWYRRPRPDACSLASDPWVVTQVIVIGRAALARCELDHRLPPERQRTFTDLSVAPSWVGDVVRALAVAQPPSSPEPEPTDRRPTARSVDPVVRELLEHAARDQEAALRRLADLADEGDREPDHL